MIVLDASLALEVLLDTPRGLRCADHIFGRERHSPHLVDVEFAHALRRLTLAGKISNERASLALTMFRELALVRHSHWPLLPRMWELRGAMSAYDATYVALAEALGVPLLTCDGGLARSHGHRADIVLLD
jgi:predicted nucleic acid-binding protein